MRTERGTMKRCAFLKKTTIICCQLFSKTATCPLYELWPFFLAQKFGISDIFFLQLFIVFLFFFTMVWQFVCFFDFHYH